MHFLREGYFAIVTSHHSFELPFSFSYEFLLCVSYFGRQIDTPFTRWHSMPSDLSSLVLRIFGNAFAARRTKLWKLMAIQERWWRCRFEFSSCSTPLSNVMLYYNFSLPRPNVISQEGSDTHSAATWRVICFWNCDARECTLVVPRTVSKPRAVFEASKEKVAFSFPPEGGNLLFPA